MTRGFFVSYDLPAPSGIVICCSELDRSCGRQLVVRGIWAGGICPWFLGHHCNGTLHFWSPEFAYRQAQDSQKSFTGKVQPVKKFALRAFKAMAEREGFEPPIPVKVYTLSRRAPSATRPSLRTRWVVHHDFIREAVASNFPCYRTALTPDQPPHPA
jgi:hypothetical protein